MPLIVDNTLASPYLIRPLEWGADIVIHSATKFLGGHGNSMAGVIVDGGKFDWGSGKFPSLSEPCPSYHGMKMWETFGDMAFAIACRVLGLRDLGPALSPMNAFLVQTGIETLPLRMQKHCDNALAVAKWLKANSKVGWVNYAGLEDNACYALHKKYCPKGAGAVFTFGLKGGYEAGVKLVNGVKLFSHLANIGDTRSLIIHPASTTHRQLSDEDRDQGGRRPGCGTLERRNRGQRRHHRRSGTGDDWIGRRSCNQPPKVSAAPSRCWWRVVGRLQTGLWPQHIGARPFARLLFRSQSRATAMSVTPIWDARSAMRNSTGCAATA